MNILNNQTTLIYLWKGNNDYIEETHKVTQYFLPISRQVMTILRTTLLQSDNTCRSVDRYCHFSDDSITVRQYMPFYRQTGNDDFHHNNVDLYFVFLLV